MTTYYDYHTTDIGKLLLAGDGNYLSLLGFPQGKMLKRHEKEWVKDPVPFKEVKYQLDAYFAGELQDFDLPLLWGASETYRQAQGVTGGGCGQWN